LLAGWDAAVRNTVRVQATIGDPSGGGAVYDLVPSVIRAGETKCCVNILALLVAH